MKVLIIICLLMVLTTSANIAGLINDLATVFIIFVLFIGGAVYFSRYPDKDDL